MALDWLREAISEESPCGPDLEAIDDGPFVDFYFEAESEMPERYFTPGVRSKDDEFLPGVLFDKKSIDLKKLRPLIEGLLRRSRDLRLLSIMARLSVLGGDIKGFAEALTGIADVMETFAAEMHPRNHSDRRSALDELGSATQVCIPLTYIQLAGPGEVTLRRYQVALGESEPRSGEVGLTTSGLLGELGSAAHAKAVDTVHTALSAAQAALQRIKTAALQADPPFNPDIEPACETIRQIQALIAQVRPDLQPWAAASQAEPADDPVSGDDAPQADVGADAPAAVPTRTAAPVVTKIPNRAAARQTLAALETYFATHEPASPALLLITQARLLVGKPLIEAIETLLPGDAARTTIDFGPATGFRLDMARLKSLSQEAATRTADTADEGDGTALSCDDRAEVAGHLNALDEFYRAREPASPIPLLIQRARSYLEKDFAAIVAELLPAKTEKSSE